MTLKKHLKTGIRLCIEGDGNPVTIAIRLSKSQLLAALDYLIPDDDVVE
jgi:3'-phosphoadenosine 5'-phosphosulfate (PAPS) 3'-phosphatase